MKQQVLFFKIVFLSVVMLLGLVLSLANITQAQTFSCDNVTGIPVTECNELVTLYNSTNGVNWTNKTGWLTSNTPCSWFGLTCSAGHVSRIDLRLNHLSGTIPDFSHLPNLTGLWLGNNLLNGTVPNFSNLPNLTNLYLYGNQLNGMIPNFTNLPNLTELSLHSNKLSGTIPDFSHLPKLTLLYLSYNQLSGTIPDFNNLSNLKELDLSANQLNGIIPNFDNLLNLMELALSRNQLRGQIPDFSNLPKLTMLFLYTNQLSGTIPNFSNLPKLTILYLYSNQLSGTIPSLNWSSFNALLLNNNCGLVAYDVAQATVLNSKDSNWQVRNPVCGGNTPTATATNTPRPTPTPNVTPTPLYFNDFSTPTWYSGQDSDGYCDSQYKDGKYQLTATSGHECWRDVPIGSKAEVTFGSFEVEVYQNHTSSNFPYALYINGRDRSEQYLLKIFPNSVVCTDGKGKMELWRTQNGTPRALMSLCTTLVHSGVGTNIIKLRHTSNGKIAIYVNGDYLSTYTDSAQLTGKSAGVYVMAKDKDVVVTFDNFTVYSVPTSAMVYLSVIVKE